jgi:hypothetical protein
VNKESAEQAGAEKRPWVSPTLAEWTSPTIVEIEYTATEASYTPPFNGVDFGIYSH